MIETGVIPPPDFIKCDVEGAELRVFQGARKTLDRLDAPIILFEANACASSAFDLEVSAAKDFLATLEKPSYRFFEIRDGANLANLQALDSNFTNVLAVPKSKLLHWPEIPGEGA